MPSIITRTTSATDATVKGLPLTNAEIDGNFIAINNAIIETGDLTGFTSRATSTLAWNDNTRTFSLAPTSGAYTVYYKGKALSIPSTLQIQINNSSGGRWIILDPSTLTLSEVTTFPFTSTILVAYIYYAVGGGAIVVGDERHAASRDTQWHYSQHTQVGAVWVQGGDCTYTLNSQSAITLGFTTTLIADEDLVHTIVNGTSNGSYQQPISSNATIPVVYMNGANTAQAAPASNFWQVGLTAKFNQYSGGTWSLVDAPNNSYVNYWIVATNDMFFPIKAVIGRTSHATLMSAYNETISDLNNLMTEEAVVMYQVTIQTSTAYSNKVVISSVRKISSQANLREDHQLNGITHAGLSKLSDDDHLQYVHIANSRTITAAHTFNGVQTFVNGIKINVAPVANLDGSNKQYVDQQALIMSLMLS